MGRSSTSSFTMNSKACLLVFGFLLVFVILACAGEENNDNSLSEEIESSRVVRDADAGRRKKQKNKKGKNGKKGRNAQKKKGRRGRKGRKLGRKNNDKRRNNKKKKCSEEKREERKEGKEIRKKK